MKDISSNVGANNEGNFQDIGRGKIVVNKPVFEFRQISTDEKGRGRKSIFESVRTMALLESAYKIGATHGEAALHAGILKTAIEYHTKNRTELAVFVDGEDTGERVLFPDLIELWQGNITLAAKNAIYSSIAAKNTQDSWRLLERKQNDWALQKGQGSVDGPAPSIDLGAEAMARLAKYQKPESPNGVEQTGVKSQTDVLDTLSQHEGEESAL